MKKTILTIMVVALAITSIAMFAACGDKTPVSVEKIKVIDINLTDEEYAFGVAKENTELLKSINTAYAELDADGTIKEINNKYFGDGTPTPVVSAKKDDSKDQLVVATETGFAPFEYKDGNKLLGLDMEIMAAIATKLNKELVVVDMDFDAVVTSVKTGQADVAAAALTVTEKRQESINFSNTYYQASQVAIIKADNEAFKDCKTAEDVKTVIAGLEKGTKAAFQIGTTGDSFVKEFTNLTAAGYKKVGLATTDLINGQVGLIIVDKAPAAAILASVNK